MAKAQKSFADKSTKSDAAKKGQNVRVIRTVRDTNTGAVRFLDRMVNVPEDANNDQYLKDVLKDGD